MTDRSTLTRTLPMLELAPAGRAAAPRTPIAPDDERLAEYVPESRTLPRFHVWTLGCQMNRSDSEEMAGRLLAAGCDEAPSLETADLVVINTCAIREGAEQKVIGRQGQLAKLKAANPAMRVVLTGCSVREPDRAGLRRRYPAVDLFLRPDEEPELVDRLGLASAQAPIGAAGPSGATTTVGRTVVGAADHLPATRALAVGQGTVARGSAIAAWLPIIYGCDKTCTYCIVPFSRGPERSRPFDDIVDEARALAAAGYREVTLLGQNVNSYGHDLPPEPRFGHVHEARWAGRRLDLAGRPDLAELIRTIDGLRTVDGRPAIGRLRFVTSHPWDLSDRLIAALAACDSVCEHLHLPVQSGSDAVLRRMGRQYTIEHYRERLARIREAVPDITISTDVIVGFCGETEAQFEATLALLETVRYDQVFAAAYSPRPGTPATHLADDVPAADKRRRLNTLLAVQESIGLERNRAWLGREVPVLVDAIQPERPHGHDADALRDGDGQHPSRAPARAGCRAGRAATSSSTSRATRRWSGARSSSGSTTPAHTRCGARSSGRDRRTRRGAATRRGRRRHGHRQDRAGDPAGRGLHRERTAGGRHLGRFAPGLSRPRHRDGQGQPGGSGAGRPSRPRPGRSRPAVQRGRLRGPRPGRPGRDRPAGGVAILAGGTGLYLRAVARGLDTDALPSDPRLRARLEAELIDDGLGSLVARLRAIAPGASEGVDLRNPRRVVRALEIAELAGDRPRPAALGYPGPSTWIGLKLEPAAHADRIARRAQAQFDAGLIDEARVAP